MDKESTLSGRLRAGRSFAQRVEVTIGGRDAVVIILDLYLPENF